MRMLLMPFFRTNQPVGTADNGISAKRLNLIGAQHVFASKRPVSDDEADERSTAVVEQ